MPLHDWTRVPSGLFHHFHQRWTTAICDALNRGALLPPGFSALIEQKSGPVASDVLTLDARPRSKQAVEPSGGLAVAAAPEARVVRRSNKVDYAKRANRIAIKHHLGRTVAVIELVSPGNKDSRPAFRDFVDKMVEFVNRGVHLLVIDPFPPGPRDPSGVHKALWDEIGEEEPFEFPAGKDRLLVSYVSASERVAYVEPVGVGDPLPDRPVFLTDRVHVPVPLGPAYEEAWAVCPEPLREAVLTGVLPTDEDEGE
ncbi:MAG: DUF4058 family protein [Gemmataceae bacterium]